MLGSDGDSNTRPFPSPSTCAHADALHGLEKFALGLNAGGNDDLGFLAGLQAVDQFGQVRFGFEHIDGRHGPRPGLTRPD